MGPWLSLKILPLVVADGVVERKSFIYSLVIKFKEI